MTTADAVLPANDLEALATRALLPGGMRGDDAAEAVRILVLADLFGIRTHGVQRIPEYRGRVKAGGIDPLARPRIERPGRAETLAGSVDHLCATLHDTPAADPTTPLRLREIAG